MDLSSDAGSIPAASTTSSTAFYLTMVCEIVTIPFSGCPLALTIDGR